MRALVKAKREVGIWMQDVPKPVIGPNDVLVKVRKTAICKTAVYPVCWDIVGEARIGGGNSHAGGSHAGGRSAGSRGPLRDVQRNMYRQRLDGRPLQRFGDPVSGIG